MKRRLWTRAVRLRVCLVRITAGAFQLRPLRHLVQVIQVVSHESTVRYRAMKVHVYRRPANTLFGRGICVEGLFGRPRYIPSLSCRG